MKDRIFLSSPHMSGVEMKFVDEAFESNWVAPLGKNVDEFEREMSQFIGCTYGVALSSGSAAIHLGLKYLGVGKGDIVFCSSFTFSGSCNAIKYLDAQPVFIDCDYETYNMSPVALAKAYEKYPNPKAVIIVDLYGNPANYEQLLKITNAHETPVLEDAAEALGSAYKGVKTGNFGDLGVLSFNGNKIITTSGGGMALVKDKETKAKLTFWSTQSRENTPWYEHKEVGYNYRLSNICAGIGRGQLTAIEDRIARKRRIYEIYSEEFSNNAFIAMIPEPKHCFCNHWLSVITLREDCKASFMDIVNRLAEENIESRPAWKPMHMQPVFAGCSFFNHHNEGISVSEDLFNRSVCLPSDTKMTDDQVRFVAKLINEVVSK